MSPKVLPQIIAISLTTVVILLAGCTAAKSSEPEQIQTQDQENGYQKSGTYAHRKNVGSAGMIGHDSMMGEGMMNNDMKGKMDMNKMQGMMNQCMTIHKDDKMCNNTMMTKCQDNANRQDCMRIMAEVQKKNSENNKKK